MTVLRQHWVDEDPGMRGCEKLHLLCQGVWQAYNIRRETAASKKGTRTWTTLLGYIYVSDLEKPRRFEAIAAAFITISGNRP